MAALGEGAKASQAQNGIPSFSPVTSGIDHAHACNVLNQLKTMYEEELLTDVVVHVDQGKSFSCHRNILAAISPYFRTMFTSGLTESIEKDVRLVGIEPESMQLILNYAYTSIVQLTEGNVQALFTATSIFQIAHLQDQCANYMISRLDPQNCIGVFIFADYFGHRELKIKSQDYIRKKILCVAKEREFLRLKKDQLIGILSSDDLDVEKEEHVYDCVISWYEHDQESREEHLPEIFAKCIRVPLMDSDFVENIPPMFAQAMPKNSSGKGKVGAKNCIQRIGMTAAQMIICFEALSKHSGRKQNVPCLDIYTTRVYKLCKPPGDLREVGILVTPDNDIYIAGGYRPSNNDVCFDHKAEREFWLYDHATNKWILKAPMLRARIGCVLVYCSGKPYAIGGRVYEGDGRNPVKALESYDCRDNCWATISQMPVIMEFHCAVVYKEKIYIPQGPISSILVNRYGSRPVVIFGGLLSSIGMIIATFSTSILQLYISIGVIAGFGFSMNLQPSVIVVGKYFQKRRPIANGLAMAGSPVVLSTLAPFNQLLFDWYGWRGSFFILGALLLNCCVAGALFRPIGPKVTKSKKQKDKNAVKENTGLVEKGEIKTEEDKTEASCIQKFNKVLDLTLFKHRGFLIYLVGNVIMFLAFYAPIVFLTPYAKHLGVDEYSAAFLLSVLAIVDMIARPVTGIVANTKWIRPRIQYFFSAAITFNGFCHLMCPIAEDYAGLVVYSVFFGLGFGMVCALLFETLMDLVGAKRFSSAVGLVTIVECVPLLIGPPLGGAIVDASGNYKYMFYTCGATIVFAGLFLFVMNFYNYRMLEKEEKERQDKEIEMKESNGFFTEEKKQVLDADLGHEFKNSQDIKSDQELKSENPDSEKGSKEVLNDVEQK